MFYMTIFWSASTVVEIWLDLGTKTHHHDYNKNYLVKDWKRMSLWLKDA